MEINFSANKIDKKYLFKNIIHNQGYQNALAGHHLSRVEFKGKGTDINGNKINKTFYIKNNASDLGHNQANTEIKEILRDVGIISQYYKPERILGLLSCMEEYSSTGKITIYDLLKIHNLPLQAVNIFLEGNVIQEYKEQNKLSLFFL